MRKKKSRDMDDFVEVPSDEPLSLDGTVLDPSSTEKAKVKFNI